MDKDSMESYSNDYSNDHTERACWDAQPPPPPQPEEHDSECYFCNCYDLQMKYFHAMSLYVDIMKYHHCLQSIICLFGITINMVNMKVFIKMGLKERFPLVLFNIALADLSYNFFKMLYEIVNFSHHFLDSTTHTALIKKLKFEPEIVKLYSQAVATTMVTVYSLLTVLIGILSCTFLTWHQYVRMKITRQKIIFITVSIWGISLAMHVTPYLTGTYLQANNASGVTIIDVAMHHNFHRSQNTAEYVSSAIGNCLSPVIIVICLLILAWKVRKALANSLANFSVRNSSKPRSSFNDVEICKTDDINTAPFNGNGNGNGIKEARCVKQGALILTLFLLIHSYSIYNSIATLMSPSMGYYEESLMDMISTHVPEYCISINSIAKFFIYFKHNPKYRKTCLIMVHCTQAKSKEEKPRITKIQTE